tara:strand:- start:22 stop:381 length:360 start_codon:yes stop_codon:yes gene_type:complete
MQEPHKLFDKTSFDNYLDHKDELEKKYSSKLGNVSRLEIDKAVLSELRKKKLISEYFYRNQIETLSFIDHPLNLSDFMVTFLNMYFTLFIFGILVIIASGEFKYLAKETSLNNSFHNDI